MSGCIIGARKTSDLQSVLQRRAKCYEPQYAEMLMLILVECLSLCICLGNDGVWCKMMLPAMKHGQCSCDQHGRLLL